MNTKSYSDISSVLAVAVLLSLSFYVVGCQSSKWECLKDVINDVSCAAKRVAEGLLKHEPVAQHNKENVGPITSKLVAECLRSGREIARASSKRGNELIKNGFSLESCSPAMLHFFSSKLEPDVKKSVEASHELLAATKLMQMKVRTSNPNVTANTFMSFLEKQVIKITDPTICSSLSLVCNKEKYRTIDGSCNNEKHPGWGRRSAPFTRIVPPRYADGIYAMPIAKSGKPLPNPRVLSMRLFGDQPITSKVLTYMNMQWGQFITHDLTSHVMEVTDEGGIQCCIGDGRDVLPQEYLNDKCIPIIVNADDPFYRYYDVKCLNFVRSATATRDDCTLGYAEQMNTVTSFLDATSVYGSDNTLANQLRSKKNGKLIEVYKEGCKRGFLPPVKDKSSVCDLKNTSEPCYLAGDGRINQTPTLALIHTLFLREHNRIADILSALNPRWTDEKVYQETRRIVIAEIQHITYQEWLPLNFGEKYMRHHRISPSTFYSHDYNEQVNPGIINGFSAGAFRFLHTIVPDAIMTCSAGYNSVYLHRLSDHYLNPRLLEYSSSSFDDVVRGIITQSAAEADPYCTEEITNLLFKSCNNWGMDLVAMDIQRGRDHGLASYNDYRETCGLTRARTFQDLEKELSQDRINALTKLYESVDDIDLFVGGAMESDIQGSILGPTFQCIVSEQFYRTRIGDRYFYDHGEMPHSFLPDQLKEIKKASMARLICDNTDVKFVQKYAFEMESAHNPRISCKDKQSIPYVDLTAWKVASPLDLY